MEGDLGRIGSRYPRASTYDPVWTIETRMGPNVLWLAEWLSEITTWRPGARVLDLGCGMAASSIFLAREFDLSVVAADLWVDPTENWTRIEAAGLGDRVTPLRAEAHELPFARSYFDAVVSLDAYHYFGTDEAYLPYLARFVRPGGSLAIVVPSVRHELGGRPPAGLEPFWQEDMSTFHTPAWWREHLGRHATVEAVGWHERGWEEWLAWCEICGEHLRPLGLAAGDDECAEMLRADGGRVLGLVRAVARLP